MRFLRRLYLRLYEQIKGHYPVGTLVRYCPPVGFDGIHWTLDGDPKYNDVGLVVGGWCRVRAPFPGALVKGSVVLFGGKTRNMENWDVKVIDETG